MREPKATTIRKALVTYLSNTALNPELLSVRSWVSTYQAEHPSYPGVAVEIMEERFDGEEVTALARAVVVVQGADAENKRTDLESFVYAVRNALFRNPSLNGLLLGMRLLSNRYFTDVAKQGIERSHLLKGEQRFQLFYIEEQII